MTLASWAVNTTIWGLMQMLCKINDEQLARVPKNGPLILVANHINFLEIPVVFTHLLPRPVTGFVKSETWENPVMGALFNIWGGIPIRRGEADMEAYRLGLEALKAGKIVAVAPEGTRSNNGRLQRGYSGVVTLALHSNAPLLPLVYYGSEHFRSNLARLRRTDFNIRVGRSFTIDTCGQKVTRAVRQDITNEIMYQLALLLPPVYRGVYANLDQATQNYLRFLE
jgi:1-acyl-sn-glycerol-3-phosphate acyltransferase